VYGLGADALNERAVRSIFTAKGRPADNPLIVHISALSEIESLVDGALPDDAKRLAAAYWPGPLTMILPKSPLVPYAVTAGLDTVAIRLPAHGVARELIRRAGVPVAAPSANRSGRPSPTTAGHVYEDMKGRIPLILDGGPCAVGLESTVVDLTRGRARVLRPGGVTPEMIERVLGAVDIDPSLLRPLREGEIARSPGMKYRHYAPAGELTIVEGGDHAVARTICHLYDRAIGAGRSARILALSAHAAAYGGRSVRCLGDDANAVAAELFSALREMDEAGVERIFSEAVAAKGMGLAVMNRLGRAAGFHTLNAAEEEQ
jgi:L-threonylcarbamoyladenylate synthase